MEETEREEGRLAYGKEFAGKYHVGEQIGSGGYGKVYRAREIELDRDVALKVLDPSDVDHEHKRRRFLREARLVAGLEEPQTITLYDYGESEGLLYLAFEYVEGQTLGEYVAEKGALSPYEVLKLLEQILDSLQEAHEQGVLHRDVKPGNVMVYEHDRRGLEIKVLDFGIGKFLEEEKERQKTQLTREGSMMGTPRYMSPEQMKGRELGPEADLWSVGVVALEALMGEHVIESSQAMVIQSEILEKKQEPFVVPEDQDVPVFFRRILEKLLRKSRTQRYDSAKQVQEDIAKLRHRESGEFQKGGSEALGQEEDNNRGEFAEAETVGEMTEGDLLDVEDPRKSEEGEGDDGPRAMVKGGEERKERGSGPGIAAIGGLVCVLAGGVVAVWMNFGKGEGEASAGPRLEEKVESASNMEDVGGMRPPKKERMRARKKARSLAKKVPSRGRVVVGRMSEEALKGEKQEQRQRGAGRVGGRTEEGTSAEKGKGRGGEKATGGRQEETPKITGAETPDESVSGESKEGEVGAKANPKAVEETARPGEKKSGTAAKTGKTDEPEESKSEKKKGKAKETPESNDDDSMKVWGVE